MLRLVKMEETYIPQLFEMMEEWTQAGEKIIPGAIRKCDYRDTAKYIASLEVKEPDGKYVPASTFFCLDTERNIFVGAVSIRHYLSESLLRDGRAYPRWHTAQRGAAKAWVPKWSAWRWRNAISSASETC